VELVSPFMYWIQGRRTLKVLPVQMKQVGASHARNDKIHDGALSYDIRIL
jgi:hypothetical protein